MEFRVNVGNMSHGFIPVYLRLCRRPIRALDWLIYSGNSTASYHIIERRKETIKAYRDILVEGIEF